MAPEGGKHLSDTFKENDIQELLVLKRKKVKVKEKTNGPAKQKQSRFVAQRKNSQTRRRWEYLFYVFSEKPGR